jgi:hypothetical protein
LIKSFSKKLAASMLVVVAATLVACGGGSNPQTVAPLTAQLTDGPVKGVCYLASPSGLSGSTDAAGSYNFKAGDSVAFWIDTSGAGCGSTPATSSTTTGISLGAVTPTTTATGTTQQTFILSLSTGAQAAETLQALNHGTTTNMDVSGVTLPAANVRDINSYVASAGGSTGTASTVVTLFTAAQTAATVSGATLVPNLPVTSTFQTTVVNNLSTTVSSGLGAAPTNFSITPGTLVFAINSGNITATQNIPNETVGPTNNARFFYYGANGAGRRLVSGDTQHYSTFTLHDTTGNANLATVDQALTYSVTGNTISQTFFKLNKSGAPTYDVNTTKTMTYFDGKAGFYTIQSSTSGDPNATPPLTGTDTQTASGADVRLTPLTLSMFAGKVLKFSAPSCTNGVATWTFSADGSSANSDCGTNHTFTTLSDMPGILINTGTDGSILFIGLDGPSLGSGAAIVFITGNPGTSNGYPAWGRSNIISVQ